MDTTETYEMMKSKIHYDKGCHLWTGTLVKGVNPYYNNKNVKKFIWNLQNDKDDIEKNQIIKLTCDNFKCVKLEHMYLYQFDYSWEGRKKLLLSKTDKVGDCLLWNGFINEVGYGMSSFKGKGITTHRLAYMIKIQSEVIPNTIDGEVSNVMHMCGNRACVNSDHLQLGTVKENASHKVEHGTHQRGETSARATISEETAQNILDAKIKRGEDGYETQKQIAKRFKTTTSVVKNIHARQSWGHLEDKRNGTESVRDKINERNSKQLKLQKDIILSEEQYIRAGKILESKCIKVQRQELKRKRRWYCWEYANSVRTGYGQFSCFNITKGAHIWSCEIKNKRSRVEGEVTIHLCNNRLCANPEHLEFGTNKENQVHSVISGSKSCKLTPENVREIRESSLSCAEMSNIYNVGEDTVRRARDGKTYTGVK